MSLFQITSNFRLSSDQRRAAGRLVAVALVLALSLWTFSPLFAAAQSLEEYFQISYDPVSFSKSEINGSEVFHAMISGRATCAEDLPMTVNEASITSCVVAEHAVSGARVTLNSSYTVTIKPFPSKQGETAEIDQVVPLEFPAQAESGDYNIIGELTEAKVKVIIKWVNVTEFLPRDQLLGSLKYIAPETTPPPESEPEPASEEPNPAPELEPASEETTPAPELEPTPIPVPSVYGIAWWVWLIVAVAVVTTIVNIVSLLRRRTT